MNIIKWEGCSENLKNTLLNRPAVDNSEDVLMKVNEIIVETKKLGDEACLYFTEKFDGVKLNKLSVENEDIEKAEVSDDLEKALTTARRNIIRVQTELFPKNTAIDVIPGMVVERKYTPIKSVGLYVPAGSAPLISTLMMLAIPAKIAGCKTIIICTPPNSNGKIDPAILYAAKICGIEKIYSLGGAQAIAAMAYGTQTIPKVDKIFGPGNTWVTIAKQLVAQDPIGPAIDLPAGPSELMVIADDDANEEIIAADLLSQAEHSPDSQVFLITDSTRIVESINKVLYSQLERLYRKKIAEIALSNSKVIFVNNLMDAIDIANRYGPEHLSLQCKNSSKWISKIYTAGTVFLGENTAESFGDYITGSNHVLPTNGAARSYSGLSVNDYMRSFSVQRLEDEAFLEMSSATICLAEAEGLTAHSNAVKIRLLVKEKTL